MTLGRHGKFTFDIILVIMTENAFVRFTIEIN